MRIAKVIGKLTLSQADPCLKGARWVIGLPMTAANLKGESSNFGEEFVIYDELGAGPGHLIAVSEGAEASQAFHPAQKAIDAYCAAILDNVSI